MKQKNDVTRAGENGQVVLSTQASRSTSSFSGLRLVCDDASSGKTICISGTGTASLYGYPWLRSYSHEYSKY